MKEYIIFVDESTLEQDELEWFKEQGAKELIRCKDCDYSFFKEGVVLPEHIVCTKPFTERWQAVKPDNWFCADGKRKEVK